MAAFLCGMQAPERLSPRYLGSTGVGCTPSFSARRGASLQLLEVTASSGSSTQILKVQLQAPPISTTGPAGPGTVHFVHGFSTRRHLC